MDIATILTKRYAGIEWTLSGDDYTGLAWFSETPKPTKKALEAYGLKYNMKPLMPE